MTELDNALAAARAANWPACLTALLQAWRDHRTTELADAIDLASKRARGLEVASHELGKRIAVATELDVAPIAETIRRQLRVQPSVVVDAVMLAKARPADPRIAKLLADMFQKSPYHNEHGALDRRVLDALAAIDDPRYRTAIAEAAEQYRPRRGRLVRRRAAIDHLISVAAKLAARPMPGPIALDPELVELLEREPSNPEIDALYAAVYANPSELAPRIVLGDALIERGDPRGEFIALQCGRAADAPASKRERELVDANGRIWLEQAEPFVRKEGVVFRRGFVACARLVSGHDGGGRVWRTLEELDLSGVYTDEPIAAWLARLPQLRRVWGLSAWRWEPVLAVPQPWTTLGVRDVFSGRLPVLLAARDNLAELVELDLTQLGGVVELLAIADSALNAQLHRVRIALPSRQLAALNAVLGVAVRELEVVPQYSFPPLEDGPIARFASRRAELIARTPKDVRYLLALLRALDVGSITAATIVAPPKADTRALVAELQRLQVTS